MVEKFVICDTDVIIDYLNVSSVRNTVTNNSIENIIGINNVILTSITKMELMMGADNKNELITIIKKISRFKIALINENITLKAMSLFESYRFSHNMNIPDCFIAATSIITELPLFTYNIKDYKVIRSINLFQSK